MMISSEPKDRCYNTAPKFEISAILIDFLYYYQRQLVMMKNAAYSLKAMFVFYSQS